MALRLINLVNPNSTTSMTASIETTARAVTGSSTSIRAVTCQDAPASIEGFVDEALAVPSLLAEIREGERAGAVGHVIACFDDTGLDAARCVASAPVIGIGEAACHMATLVACSFSIVTTLRRSVPALTRNVRHYGFDHLCRSITAAEVEVLALDRGDGDARRCIESEIERALDMGAEAIVLGCAGMTDLASSLADTYGVPVIDGVAAAVALVEAVATTGVVTSKIGGYAPPIPKPGGAVAHDRALP